MTRTTRTKSLRRKPLTCAPGRTRTCDLEIRRLLLYPAELRRRGGPAGPSERERSGRGGSRGPVAPPAILAPCAWQFVTSGPDAVGSRVADSGSPGLSPQDERGEPMSPTLLSAAG